MPFFRSFGFVDVAKGSYNGSERPVRKKNSEVITMSDTRQEAFIEDPFFVDTKNSQLQKVA